MEYKDMEYKLVSFLDVSKKSSEYYYNNSNSLVIECDVKRARQCYRYVADTELNGYDKVFITIYGDGSISLNVRKHTQSACVITPKGCDIDLSGKIDLIENNYYFCKVDSDTAYKVISLDKEEH